MLLSSTILQRILQRTHHLIHCHIMVMKLMRMCRAATGRFPGWFGGYLRITQIINWYLMVWMLTFTTKTRSIGRHETGNGCVKHRLHSDICTWYLKSHKLGYFFSVYIFYLFSGRLSYAFHLCLCQILGHVLPDFFHIPNKPSLILSTLSIGCKWFKNFISKYFGCGFHFETTSLASESSSMIIKCCELLWWFIAISLTKSLIKI